MTYIILAYAQTTCFGSFGLAPFCPRTFQRPGISEPVARSRNPENTFVRENKCGQGKQNLSTTYHYVTAAQAPQPRLAEFSLGITLGLPTPVVPI
ncbi:hypothetical protein EVAR_68803_1 [Eumeta japonica]|uniref:Uncharacterized protein n=1 Tax=Eumeta variegata TaxID=151549 RepID=A0A4C2ADL5_EUMVA|nr:hypothetical protein EVAR_68803_1 [Eumeta japonica]